jgi:phosphonate transport system ATP-binding protein
MGPLGVIARPPGDATLGRAILRERTASRGSNVDPVLEVCDLRVRYDGGREVLKGISFSVAADHFLAIIGPSGAGKSTLIRAVNRLVEPTSGSVRFDGRDILRLSPAELRRARRHIGMIFQEFNLVERLSVIDNVLAGRLGYTGTTRSVLRLFGREGIRDALRLLDRVGLAEHVDKRADRLSGGQRQRVGIARALMQNPKLLLVDEPTSSLDPKIAREVMGLIKEVAGEFRIPVLCNIHDVSLALEFCTRVIGLEGGRKMFEGCPGELDGRALREIYAMEVR